jgi:hypothetical protein
VERFWKPPVVRCRLTGRNGTAFLIARMLAAELGTVSETLSRTLAKFREQKLLTVKGKTIVVRSPVKLNALLRRNLGE